MENGVIHHKVYVIVNLRALLVAVKLYTRLDFGSL